MLSNEPVKNPADYVVQYEVAFTKDGTDTELVKGRKVKGNDLVTLIWRLVTAVYMQMKSRKESTWDVMASYLKDELSERISMEAFWMGQFYSGVKNSVHTDKKIGIHAMLMDRDHMNLVFTSSPGLSGKDYLEGISSLIMKTYSVLLAEEGTSAQWLKYSLTFLVKTEKFWDEGTVTDEMKEQLQAEFYSRNRRFS